MSMKYFLYCLVTALFVLSSCQKKPSPEQTEKKPIVLVTIAPYAHFVKEIASEFVQVETLIPEVANPHLYEAPPQAVEKHQTAALWLYLGENFDKKMVQFLKDKGSAIDTLDLTQGIDLIGESSHASCHHHHASEQDLHLWMSPRIVKIQVEKITEKLIHLLPQHADTLLQNKNFLLQKLDALDAAITEVLQNKKGTTLLVSHPAFAYFCKDYALEQLSIEIAGKEPKPADLSHLLEHARELALPFIITEPQHSDRGAQAIASLLQIPTKEINPYAEDYFDTLFQLSTLIAHE